MGPSLNHSILIKLSSSRHTAHIGVVHLSDVLPVIKSTIIKLLTWDSSHLSVILAHHVLVTHTTGHHHLILHHVSLLSHRLDYYEVSPIDG